MATLDRKLKEIAEESSKEAPKRARKEEHPEKKEVSTSLDEQACAIMGEQLLRYFEGKLPGQTPYTNGQAVPDAAFPLIKAVGLYLFTMRPEAESNYSYNFRIRASFTEGLPEETLARIVTTACGEYAASTDLLGSAVAGGMERIVALLPEMGVMRSKVMDLNPDQLYDLATINPYLIILGMAPEHRALATLAVARAIENGHIHLGVSNKAHSQYRQQAADICQPHASDFIEAAGEHGITEVVPAMEEYRRVWKTHRV